MPGAPFWKPTYGRFDAMAQARAIAARRDSRVKYLVANFGGPDMIWENGTWRQNGRYKTDHRSHLHVSFTVAAEQSTAPFFIQEDDDMTPAEFRALMDGPGGYREQIKSDTNAVAKARLADTVPDLVEAAVKKYVEDKLGGYVNGSWKPDALADKVLVEARQKYGLSS